MSEFYQHPNALIDEGASVGTGTRVWAFAHVVKGAVVGRDCNICDHTFIEGGVRIGDRVTLKCGVYLWEGLILEDDVHIGPGAVFTNDLRPRSKNSSVVTRSVPDFALVLGIPARLVGWVCRCGKKLTFAGGDACRCECGGAYSQGHDQSISEIFA